MRSTGSLISIAIFAIGLACSANEKLDINDPSLHQWMNLLFYRNTGSNIQSKVQSEAFFAASNGRIDAEAELNAELKSFRENLQNTDSNPQCQFPARYRILKNKYNLPPPLDCPKYNNWLKNYDLSHISVIYTSQYLSNPASVFGHAFYFLVSNSVEEYMQTTLNYAAEIPPEISMPSYAYNGVTGGFEGKFSSIPFYMNRHIYSDLESREMWEYKLNLSHEEQELLMSVFWEITNKARYHYYFLDENCGSVLLWTLAAVKPNAEFAASNPIYFPPGEITKILYKNNLVSEIRFHPSLTQSLLAKIDKMSAVQKNCFYASIKNEKLCDQAAEQIVLDALIDHINILRYKKNGVLDEQAIPFEKEVLLARSKITNLYHPDFVRPSEPAAPHLSHPNMKIQLGGGNLDSTPYQSFLIRPAIHGLMDSDDGYLKNSEIEILSLELRHSNEQNLYLEKLRLGALSNLTAMNSYENNMAWRTHADYLQNHFGNSDNHYFELLFNGGFVNDLGNSSLNVFVNLTTSLRTQVREIGSIELGPQLGLLFSHKKFKLFSQIARTRSVADANNSDWWRFENQLRTEINTNWSVFFEHSLRSQVDVTNQFSDFKISGAYYF